MDNWNQYSAVSSHYAQAYFQSVPQYQPQQSTQSRPQHPRGSHRCSHPKCSFSGSQKLVELHMMDRHLVYPPGFKKKKDNEWDADPSLKGKPIPIQGTNLVLNSPEDIDAWIAERRKRYPTAERVSDKKEKLQEAIARGQLHLDDNPRFPKRQRLDNDYGSSRGRGRGRGRGSSTPRGRGTGLPRPAPVVHALPPRPVAAYSSSSESDEDGPPETSSSKALEVTPNIEPELRSQPIVEPPALPTVKKTQVRQPRNPPLNPFASKPSLLRNLLLPEIRNTVSNLSQAIRFLVDNDFLENVELKPGDAAQQYKIEVVDSSSTDEG